MSEPSAYVYRERGRVWVRAEIDEGLYKKLRTVLAGHANMAGLLTLLDTAELTEIRRHDRSEIMERFTDAPPIG